VPLASSEGCPLSFTKELEEGNSGGLDFRVEGSDMALKKKFLSRLH
jgi:hypothetical protein